MFGHVRRRAELHLVPPELNLLPHKLAELIRSAELTQWFSVPSVLNYMAKFAVVREGDFPSLRRVLWCGEVFPTLRSCTGCSGCRMRHSRISTARRRRRSRAAYYSVPSCPASEDEAIPSGRPAAANSSWSWTKRSGRTTGGGRDLYIRARASPRGTGATRRRRRARFCPIRQHRSRRRIYRTGDLATVGPRTAVRSGASARRSDARYRVRRCRQVAGAVDPVVGIGAVGIGQKRALRLRRVAPVPRGEARARMYRSRPPPVVRTGALRPGPGAVRRRRPARWGSLHLRSPGRTARYSSCSRSSPPSGRRDS